jgi:SH3-like domain-containing protein
VGAEPFLDQSWHKIRDRTGASKAVNKRQLDGKKQFITVYNFSFDKEKAPEGA